MSENGGITIRVAVVTIVAAAVVVTGGLLLALQLYQGRELAREATQELLAQNAVSVSAALSQAFDEVDASVELLAGNPRIAELDARDLREREFATILRHNPSYYGIAVGLPDGRAHKLIHLDDPRIRQQARVLANEVWMRIEIAPEGDTFVANIGLLDEGLTLQRSRSRRDVLPATVRPWWRNQPEGLYRTRGHLIPEFGQTGRAHAMRVVESEGIVAIQYSLEDSKQWLELQTVGEEGEAYLFSDDGTIIASDAVLPERSEIVLPEVEISEAERAYLGELPILWASNQRDYPPFDYTSFGSPRGYSVELLTAAAQVLGVELRFVNGMSWDALVSQFQSGRIDMLHSLWQTPEREGMGVFSEMYYPASLALLTQPIRSPITSLEELHGQRIAQPRGWALIDLLREYHPEIEIMEVATTAEAIAAVLSGDADAALDDAPVLAYAREQYFAQGLRLHENIALQFDASNGMHLLLSRERAQLLPLMQRAIDAIQASNLIAIEDNWSSEVQSRLVSGTVPARELLPAENSSDTLTTRIDYRGEPYLMYRSLVTEGENPLYFGALVAERTIDGPLLARLRSSVQWALLLLVSLLPLSWLLSQPIVRPIRALALENDKIRRREYDAVQRVPSRVKEVDELSDSMMAMVESIKTYEQSQRELMDAFIELIAQAIDDKSPYTAAHCNRVPELALMLARVAAVTDTGSFATFSPGSDDEWREFRIAAWLHDCGKITTPEHIVDKGSKLEAIYNRIHELRTRFEVLWRDEEIAYLKAVQENPDAAADLERDLASRHQSLQADFAFVAECNVGGEFMDDDAIARLESIAERRWNRHFDDRLGLSPVEELRVGAATVDLPVEERLIADKEEHLIERPKPAVYKPELGIDMDVPERLSNLGELYNLRIGRGTLTAEDRFRINEHMISTIRMLDGLPFPEELARVPRWASTHHETMAGSGYPRRLPGDELSVPERILAVADVFEALTAADRPYKPAKSLSQSLHIMVSMVKGQHLDPECFDLFLSSGIYLEYAHQYLGEAQIDEVDVAALRESIAQVEPTPILTKVI